MLYEREIILKNGKRCQIRSAGVSDAEALLDVFIRCHEETDYLLTYPDENGVSLEEERAFLSGKEARGDEIELIALVDGKVAGIAGIECVCRKEKTRHRASFGISVLREYWGLGIGRALTDSCIEFARNAGYTQLELEVVSDNTSALALYESAGFVRYGRNPRGFLSRLTGWQELVLMRLELH